MTLRSAFADTMLRLMEEDETVIVLLGDIGVWAFREHARRWPTRVINAGVAECGMVGMAAGLAMSGLYPVVSTISSFLVRRAYEFIRLDFGEQNLPGLFVGVGGEKEYAKLGPTHMCDEEFCLMDEIPRMALTYFKPQESQVDEWIRAAVGGRTLSYMSLEEWK